MMHRPSRPAAPTRFRTRRIRNAAVVLTVVLAGAILVRFWDGQLVHTGYLTGYALGLSVLWLAGFQLRKRVPFAPLGSSSWWLQSHIYLGLATMPLFAWHVGWRLPDGYLESALASVFLMTWLSGLYGLYLSRRVPKQLAQMPVEYLAEEIPWHTANVRAQAYEVVRSAHRQSNQSILAQFYLLHLFVYFERPRSVLYLAQPTSRWRRRLLHGLHEIGRYLSAAEHPLRDRLAELVQRKDDLDFHGALQARLRMWFFAHIGLSMMLIVLGSLHGILAQAFRGGLP